MAGTRAGQATMQGITRGTSKRAWNWYRVSEGATPYLLIAPLLILIAVFIYW